MRIVIDCRYSFQSSIGNYLEGILQQLVGDDEHDYLLVGKKFELKKYGFPVLEDNNSPLTKAGLRVDVDQINRYDVFFTPNYIIPSGLKCRVYTVVHDLSFLSIEEAPTNEFLDTKTKKNFLKQAIKESTKIFVISNFIKKELMNFKATDNIVVAYPGLTNRITGFNESLEKEKYILYVGNVSETKGIETLLELAKIQKEMNRATQIKIVGESSNFRSSKNAMLEYAMGYNIEFTGRVSNEELCKLISKAKFLIQPSRYEGFGVPPLEALYLKTKPILSDIEAFKEVFEGLDVEFFKVNDARDLYLKVTTSTANVQSDQQVKILRRYNYQNTKNIIINTIMGRPI